MIDGLHWSDEIGVIPAQKILGCRILIVLVFHHCKVTSIVQSRILVTTIATVAVTVVAAIHKLLLREAVQSASLNFVAAFHASNS